MTQRQKQFEQTLLLIIAIFTVLFIGGLFA